MRASKHNAKPNKTKQKEKRTKRNTNANAQADTHTHTSNSPEQNRYFKPACCLSAQLSHAFYL